MIRIGAHRMQQRCDEEHDGTAYGRHGTNSRKMLLCSHTSKAHGGSSGVHHPSHTNFGIYTSQTAIAGASRRAFSVAVARSARGV